MTHDVSSLVDSHWLSDIAIK